MKGHCSWRVVLTLLLLLGVCFLPPVARAADPLDTVERALGLLETGEIDAARTMLAVPVDGETPLLARSAAAVTEMQAGNYAAAETAFRKVLEKDPQHVPALWGLSLCLLRQNKAFEAATLVDRAATVAPANPHIKALQAYCYLILDRISDAAAAGKIALDSGEQSPFLLATLAQVHRRMGYAQKALEFGGFAAKHYYGMDFLNAGRQVRLPLTMIIADTPKALSAVKPEAVLAAQPTEQRTDLEIEVPKTVTSTPGEAKVLQITAPAAGGPLRGVQRVQVSYRDQQEIKFVVFLVDRVLRGMTTELPYHFAWDADAVAPGDHQLSVRAYDYRGVVIAEDTITVSTVAGKALPVVEVPSRIAKLEQRIITLTMPAPAPLSLFTQLGYWHREVGETTQAIAAFEKAAAIDPTAEGLLDALAELYRINGLHPISPTGEVRRGPATGKKRVALTFDDGPNPLYTASIIDELKRYDARATFFMVGKMVQQYPELALQLIAEGHELANHSYTHPNITKLKQDDLIAEVLRTRAAIKDITGRNTYLFRPPGGNIDENVTRQLRKLDYNIIYWSINAGEFKKLTPADQAAQILARVQDGSIVLLHNGPVDGTLNILPTILADLHRRGFRCVTVSELMTNK